MRTGVKHAEARERGCQTRDWEFVPWNSSSLRAAGSEFRVSKDAEAPAEQWALLRRRLNRQPPRVHRAPIRKLIREYEEATGTGVYCD